MINEQLQSMFSDSKNLNEASITSTVELQPGKLVDSLAEETLKELQRIAPYAGYEDVAGLVVEDICRYLKTLIWLRVKAVTNGFEDKTFAGYKAMLRHLSVPVMMYQLLICIGEAWDRDYSIKFIPAYSISEADLLAPQAMLALSDVLLRLEQNGMKIVIGMPKDTAGELDFMALCHVEGVVKGYRQSHPVYGFLASFFNQQKLNEVTGSLCRIIYGYDTDYQLYISQVFRSLNA